MTHAGAPVRGVICALAAVLSVAGCSSHGNSTAAQSHSSPAASASTSTAVPSTTADPHGPSVATAPKLASDGITPLTTGARITGSATYPIPWNQCRKNPGNRNQLPGGGATSRTGEADRHLLSPCVRRGQGFPNHERGSHEQGPRHGRVAGHGRAEGQMVVRGRLGS